MRRPSQQDHDAPKAPGGEERKTWTQAEAWSLHESPFNDLLFRAHTIHRDNFDPNKIQLSQLLSIKTGAALKIAVTAVSRPATKQG